MQRSDVIMRGAAPRQGRRHRGGTLELLARLALTGLLVGLALPARPAQAQAPPTLMAPPPSALLPLFPGEPGRPLLIVNQHGGLFYESDADLAENAAYAAWLGAGAIRVFATDSNSLKPWDGRRVGQRIAQWAPSLRYHRVKLVVALVNNHRPVPGEAAESAGWMDGHFQLLLPFYWSTWRQAYLRFTHDVISSVREAGALDVIAAWELGNELHTPQAPTVFMEFLRATVAEIRRVDPSTPIWPGTMGANHLQPWDPRSPVARWLYCEAPVDAYTLHAYDWLSGDYPGDMPIHWDLDNIVSQPCPSGRRLPVVVEELGTSRALPGFYGAEDEEARLQLEQHQLRFVLGHPAVRAVGVWNGISPRVTEATYSDDRRGLTSYGPTGQGSGSCYGQAATVARSFGPGEGQDADLSSISAADHSTAGAVASDAVASDLAVRGISTIPELAAPRCRLEQLLRALPSFRSGALP